MPQAGRQGRLDPRVGDARRAFSALVGPMLGIDFAGTGRPRTTEDPETGARPRGAEWSAHAPLSGETYVPEEPPLVLVACSGGPDSLALASLAAHFARRGDLRAGAVVVDHGLQEDSREVAERAARQCVALGLDPVRIVRAEVRREGHGPEMAARLARYTAFARTVDRLRAEGLDVRAILLGHTRDDQAETVLLGLARGSGTRSLAGMPSARLLQDLVVDGERLSGELPPEASEPPRPVWLLRPLLGTDREQVEEILAAEGLEPWRDPTNQDTSLRRNRVRHEVLPFLERELGPGIGRALARTAQVLGDDADLLDSLAREAGERARTDPAAYRRVPGEAVLALACEALEAEHPALRRRILAAALTEAGGQSPTRERLAALEELLAGWGDAGPVQMPGRVAVWRRRARSKDRSGAPEASAQALVLTRS